VVRSGHFGQGHFVPLTTIFSQTYSRQWVSVAASSAQKTLTIVCHTLPDSVKRRMGGSQSSDKGTKHQPKKKTIQERIKEKTCNTPGCSRDKLAPYDFCADCNKEKALSTDVERVRLTADKDKVDAEGQKCAVPSCPRDKIAPYDFCSECNRAMNFQKAQEESRDKSRPSPQGSCTGNMLQQVSCSRATPAGQKRDHFSTAGGRAEMAIMAIH